MKTEFFWREHDHDGEIEIRSHCPYIGQESAIIYPGTRFHVKVFTGQCGEFCESATFDTLEQAKEFAERILFRPN
jgi:hypothetical protein